MDLSTSISGAKKPIMSRNSQAEQEDGLFDEFIDSDSFESSDNGAADRTNGDDWSILFDFAPPYNQISTPDSLKCNFREQRFPFAEVDKSLAVPSDADRIVSLVDFDAIKYPTPPHSTCSLSSRKSGRVHDRTALSTSKPKHSAVNKSTKKVPAPLKMSHQGGSRRPSSSEKRGSTSGSSTTSGRGQARPSHSQPPISMSQPQWSSVNPHPGYEEPYTSATQATNLPAYREPYTSQSPLHLSRTTSAQMSPVASPGYEHYGGHEEQPGYFHSPETPYVTEADVSLASDYPTFSHYPPETSYHFESAHESSMGIPYTRGGEYADSQVRTWWHSTSGTQQPYNTTYPTEDYGPHPHVSPLSATSQSERTTDIGGLMIKRHTEARQPNYSNIGYEQQQQRQPYLESHDPTSANITPVDKGRGRPHPTLRSTPQIMEPVLPSSMPSSGAPGVRKTSSSRSSQSGPSGSGSGGGGAASSSKQSKRKPGGSSRRDLSTETGFVNYTPDDSRKLLTGVAPSGSSKTKARREKEAADKRKRINRATAKAVREAGGGLEEVFKREGFILEEEDSEEEGGSPSET